MINVPVFLLASQSLFGYGTAEQSSDVVARVKRDVPYDFSKGFGGPWTALKIIGAPPRWANHSLFTRALGESCSGKKQCRPAYSYCEPPRNVCVCESGFLATKDGYCDGFFIRNVPNCPIWNSNDTSSCYDKIYKDCLVTPKSREPELSYKDDCPKGEFCFFYVHHFKDRESYVGHCCPLPPKKISFSKFRPACPLGRPQTEDKDCSRSEHTRINFQFVKDGPKRSVCCSIPCINPFSTFAGSFVFQNRCNECKLLNDMCEIDLQCPIDHACVSKATSLKSTCQKKFKSSSTRKFQQIWLHSSVGKTFQKQSSFPFPLTTLNYRSVNDS